MTKKSIIQREQTRREFLNKNKKIYQEYLFQFGFGIGKINACKISDIEYKFVTSFPLFKESVYSSYSLRAYRIRIIVRDLSFSKHFLTGIRNRCNMSGRARRYYRIFGLSRHFLRELAYKSMLPGMVKSSWLKKIKNRN